MSKRKVGNCDVSFVEIVNWIIDERIKKGIDKRQESFRRVTKAVANLIMTDNAVKDRIVNAYMENDRRKNGYG